MNAIQVEGLSKFTRNLRKLDKEAPKRLRVALNDVSDVVIRGAKPLVPRDTGKAVGSIRARSTSKLVRVSAGGRKAPYYPWLDFGGRVGRRRSVRRPFLREGRYLYKSFYDNEDEFVRVLTRQLRAAAERAGLRVG